MKLAKNIIKKIAQAKLIGRGCNNFPTAQKWQAVKDAKTTGDKFVVCNISESEPGVFKDEYILAKYPEMVVTGIQIAMQALQASKGFIYLNPEYYTKFSEYLNAIIESKGIEIEIYAKPYHDYIGGEETAVLNSMEAERVEPRLKPPYPTTSGFLGQPTLVNNCETFYAVAQIYLNEYRSTRFYCLTHADGDREVKELPIDITIKKVLKAFGHSPSNKFFYQIGGGAAGTCYNSKQLNRNFDGLASIIIFPKDTPEKNLVLKWADFFQQESCGQCTTCREGTYRLEEMLEKFYATGKLDLPLFEDLIFTLQNTSFCPLGRISANAILSYWKNVLKKDVKNIMNERCKIK